MHNIEQLIKEKQGTIVDVRTVEEFNSGHNAGSVNIPLQDLQTRMPEIKNLKQPLILCCASGGRSGMAQQMLSQQGIDCCNAGPWVAVQKIVQTL